ncbi:MAG: UDP-N-acetylmuramoyl-tripeptide--D-alanyl-D-alanine ligase [Chloroflexota bacterium]
MLTLNHLCESLFGQSSETANQITLTNVVIDSRKAQNGSVFVAIRGGHNFVSAAFEAGASIAIISEPVEGELTTIQVGNELPGHWSLPLCIVVDDTVLALQKMAIAWRNKFSPTIIGITGSVGKSSTKELAYSVLSQKFQTLKSQGSYNNEIGLPFTLMKLHEDHSHAILEMGMYDLGEIESLCQMAKPTVGLVANVGPSHLERLGSIERIAQAKQEMVEALGPQGIAILNIDDARVNEMRHHTDAQIFTYGLTDQADLWADEVNSQGIDGIKLVLHYEDEAIHVSAPLLGRHSVHTILAATAIGLTQGLHWEEIVAGLQDPQARLRLIAIPGPQNSLILDDTYNASADSSIAALNLLHELEAKRKIAVLGYMAELGAFEEEAHRKVGRRAAEVVDLLVTVGEKSSLIAQEAIASGLDQDAGTNLENKQVALDYLQEISRDGDIILIKGSRSLGLEFIVDHLSARAQQAKAN